MRHFLELLSRFREDERGAFAMIFAVISTALIAMGGAAVDFTTLQQSRTRAQMALDAASLGLQPTIYTTPGSIQAQAQQLLLSQLGSAGLNWTDCSAPGGNKAPCATVIAPIVDTVNGQLTLTANLQVPTYFVSLVGVTNIPTQIISVATRKKLNLEVALVLDNSGSMTTSFGSGTRMTVLQASAKCAANILFYNTKLCSDSTVGKTQNDSVRMALVPFNDEVNIGVANTVDNSAANGTVFWLDRTGGSDNYFDNDNFDSDDDDSTLYNGNVDRLALFGGLTAKSGGTVPWGGCVEARYNDGGSKQYDTDDTPPNTADRQTLFTPLFAPDEPDNGSYSNNYLSDTPLACNKVGPCSVATPYSQVVAKSITSVSTTVTINTTTVNGRQSTTTTQGPTTTTVTTTVPNTSYASNGSSKATATNAQGITLTASNVCSCTGQTILSNTTTSTGQTTVTTTTPTTTTNNGYPKTTTVINGSVTTKTTTNITTTVSNETDTTPVSNVLTCQAPYAPWSIHTQTAGGLSDREMQERLCKYTGAQLTKTTKTGVGPNADCPASAIQPLTNVPASITSAINSMVAAGNTNIQEGTAWGFRVLSPTPPFTEGQPYDNATAKVMIVMTDGENTYDTDNKQNGSPLYAAYGYPWDNYRSGMNGYRGRMGSQGWSENQYEQTINSRLATTCTNAKAAGMTIYTIGLATNATSDPTGNKTLLTNCASAPADAYFPTTATDLQTAFSDIANQLAALRLAQ